ncbi:MAG: BamA/TamA family outer membrane protein [bacterium]|nr:BamA/TamA family outer membrane protein [bacterium]
MQPFSIPRLPGVLAFVIALGAVGAFAQVTPPPPPGTATATVAAGARYHGGWLRRLLLGDTYRDLWVTPIEVPVLDLGAYAGGLTPTKTGGGNQTRSLRFEDPQGREYVFRLVDKDGLTIYPGYENTVLEGATRDQISAHHPAGAVVADRLMAAAGIPHPTPVLHVMPDDPRLGKFREEFAGRLGMIEILPTVPDDTAGFAGAVAIIDSDSLLTLLDADPGTRFDARAYLVARLLDMFMNDWDRHPGNWKWARMTPGGDWLPIPRDRDKVMIEYGGLAAIAGAKIPNLVRFGDSYPSLRALTCNSLDSDRRLLGGLEAAVFDSAAVFLAGRLTDPVIEAALRAMPVEYQASVPAAAAKLMARRDLLPAQAKRFYLFLADVVDLHATDAADRATVTFIDDRHLEVEIGSGDEAPYYRRRFVAPDTREIRLYLHEGDDRAVVRGDAPPAMRVRVIGGNGANQLSDSSSAAGRPGAARFYDRGAVTGIGYGPDALFDRRPWPRPWGPAQVPGRDWGTRTSPLVGLGAPGDVGVVIRLGVNRERYGFRKYPYASRTALIGEYAAGVGAWRVTGLFDKRREESAVHVTAAARMSEIEVLNFHGLGNDTPDGPMAYHETHQRQWLFHPAVAYALGRRSDIFLGPVIQYSTTGSSPGHYLYERRPYGYGDYGQAGLRLGLYSDTRNRSKDPSRGLLLDLSATVYPAVWDVVSTFGVLAVNTGGYYSLHLPLRPVLALRAGGKKVYGEFPFHEAAFIGGRSSVRGLDRERYAGDAAVYGTAELQITLIRFAVLLPLDIGVYGYGDAGRVYADWESPGGWHDSTGVGFWVGVLNPATAVSLELGDPRGRSGFRVRTGLTF